MRFSCPAGWVGSIAGARTLGSGGFPTPFVVGLSPVCTVRSRQTLVPLRLPGTSSHPEARLAPRARCLLRGLLVVTAVRLALASRRQLQDTPSAGLDASRLLCASCLSWDCRCLLICAWVKVAEDEPDIAVRTRWIQQPLPIAAHVPLLRHVPILWVESHPHCVPGPINPIECPLNLCKQLWNYQLAVWAVWSIPVLGCY